MYRLSFITHMSTPEEVQITSSIFVDGRTQASKGYMPLLKVTQRVDGIVETSIQHSRAPNPILITTGR